MVLSGLLGPRLAGSFDIDVVGLTMQRILSRENKFAKDYERSRAMVEICPLDSDDRSLAVFLYGFWKAQRVPGISSSEVPLAARDRWFSHE